MFSINCHLVKFNTLMTSSRPCATFSTSETISPQSCLPCQQYKLQNELLLTLNLGTGRGYIEQVKTQKQSDMPWLCGYADTSNRRLTDTGKLVNRERSLVMICPNIKDLHITDLTQRIIESSSELEHQNKLN